MHMVGHQYVCVEGTTGGGQQLLEESQVELSVRVVRKAGAAVHAAVRDVRRMTGKEQTGVARHGRNNAAAARQVHKRLLKF